MPHFDLFRELMFVIGITAATVLLSIIYAALENVFPFLRGGLGRLN